MAENPLPNANPPANPEPTPDPFMGYGSAERLRDAKIASDREASRMNQRLQELERTLVQMSQPQQPQNDPWQTLADLGVPPDVVRAAIRQGVHQELEPFGRVVNARQNVVMRNPDYGKFEPEVNRWLAENPELQERYNRDLVAAPETAMEWALDRFTQSRRGQATPSVADNPAGAAIPGGSQIPSNAGAAGPSKEEFEQAIAYGKQFGDWAPFMRLRTQGTSIEAHTKG